MTADVSRLTRWGWRRAAIAARKAGWAVNNKRVGRLWRDEGLRVPQRGKKKRLTGIGAAVGAMCPIRPNVIWAMGFQFDTTADGRTIKMLNVIDEFTREALAIHVDRAINVDGVVDVLDQLALQHGANHGFDENAPDPMRTDTSTRRRITTFLDNTYIQCNTSY